jgi:thiamine-phosphate pyrophosphorylase
MSGLDVTSPVICIVTRGRGAADSDERRRLVERLAAGARAGASMVQIRERQFDDRQLMSFVKEVVAAVRPAGARVLVNERPDVALAAGADGVHLKSDGPSASDARRIVPKDFLIGRSVHSEAEAAAVAAAGGCDYLIFGTVFPSTSKAGDHPVAGLEALRHTCGAVSLPVIAIGGMSVARAHDVRAAGAAGMAAISLFAEAQNIAALTASLRDALTLAQGNV